MSSYELGVPNGTKPSWGPVCDVLEVEGLPFIWVAALHSSCCGLDQQQPTRASGFKSLFRCVYTGAKGVTTARRHIPEVALHGMAQALTAMWLQQHAGGHELQKTPQSVEIHKLSKFSVVNVCISVPVGFGKSALAVILPFSAASVEERRVFVGLRVSGSHTSWTVHCCDFRLGKNTDTNQRWPFLVLWETLQWHHHLLLWWFFNIWLVCFYWPSLTPFSSIITFEYFCLFQPKLTGL